MKGRTVLVTGSAKGLGREILLAFARRQANCVVHYNNSARQARQVESECNKVAKSMSVKADLSSDGSISEMFGAIENEFGSVDILVNGVGDFIYKPLPATTAGDWQSVFRSNLFSAINCSLMALPSMRKKKFGRIMNFGCAGAASPVVRHNTTPYYAAKTALLTFSRALAVQEAGNGITVNVVSPGVLVSSVVKPRGLPMGQIEFDSVVAAIMFLVDAKQVNGANLEVSGGWLPGYK